VVEEVPLTYDVHAASKEHHLHTITPS
jgi:hypothetical protein